MSRLLLLLALALCACPNPKKEPEPSGRCEVDLAATGLFSAQGQGAKAAVITSAAQLIGGGAAQGRLGDVRLENDKVRVVVQQVEREIGATPYGGALIDADIVRPAGESGRDEFGKMAPIYAFGRTVNVKKVEVLNDGAQGGFAVVAATGTDDLVDYINVNSVIGEYLGSQVSLVADPNTPVPLTATTYYVLSPGESRVRVLTAFCNAAQTPVTVQMGDLVDQGGVSDLFNPTGCAKGFGSNDCLVDPMTWFGYQAEAVAYAYRAYKFGEPTTVANSAVLYISGITAVLADGEGQKGLLSWVDPQATRRPGAFGVLSLGHRNFLRDLFIGRDLGALSGGMLALDGATRGRLRAVVTSGGVRVDGARVAVRAAGDPVTVLVTNSGGEANVELPPGDYEVGVGAVGRALTHFKPVTVTSSGEALVELEAGATRTLTVDVKDPFNAPLSARVVVRCASNCGDHAMQDQAFQEVEALPSNIQAVGFAGADGRAVIHVPPGQYEVLVSRGMEYSAFPDTFPTHGTPVDLTTADATTSAVLAHVVDTTGWMSADLHVHAAGSNDSAVANSERALSFAAEGVDVLVSTDHDVVTDYGPLVRDLGLSTSMATMIGNEVTPFDFGHHNTFPLIREDLPSGGAFDWAGGDGPTLRLDQMYAGIRETYPGALIQMNHPRGSPAGSLTMVKIDTLTGATHTLPGVLRQEPHPMATPQDTRLFSPEFDAFEVMNGASASYSVLNDWMTFLSRGLVKVATGVSDTHYARMVVGGYGRTWIKLGVDRADQFTPTGFTAAMRARRVVLSSGPFITMSARRLDSTDQPVGEEFEVGDTVKLGPTDRVQLTVDVQAPEWMQFDSVELYTHATGREATNGESNSAWPDARILQKRVQSPAGLTLEAVPGLNGFQARRVHVVERFTVTPGKDTWYVAMVRASGASRTLAPMAWDRVRCNNGVCAPSDSRGMGLTNPIFIDADGSGAYDDFPLKAGQPLVATPKPQVGGPRRVPTMDEVNAMLHHLIYDRHGDN